MIPPAPAIISPLPPPLLDLVRAAETALSAHPSCAQQTQGLSVLSRTPMHVAIVGLTGVGKTSLFNQLTSADAATGLGGVTEVPCTQVAQGAQWTDTPGIDRAWPAVNAAIEDVDVVLWVVDGLRPLGQRARQHLQQCIDRGYTVRIVVSRADLVPAEEHADIVSRVAHLVPQAAETPIRCVRANQPVGRDCLHDLLRSPTVLSPHRLRALRQLLQSARSALGPHAIPTDAPLAHVRERWRHVVGTLYALAPTTPLDTLPQRAMLAAQGYLDSLSQHPATAALTARYGLPPLPRPALPQDTGAAGHLLWGSTGRQRRARRALGSWLVDGEAAIDLWAHEVAQQEAHLAQSTTQAAHGALDRVEEGLR